MRSVTQRRAVDRIVEAKEPSDGTFDLERIFIDYSSVITYTIRTVTSLIRFPTCSRRDNK